MTPQLWQSFQNQEGFSTASSSSWQTLLAMLNTKSGPLADVRVRQAVSKAIDWTGAIAALHGSAQLLSGVIPPGLWGHTDGLEPKTDVAGATALLKQAGYGPGGKPLPLTLTYTQGDATEELLGSLIKSDLAKVNIDLNVQGLAWPTQWAKAKSSEHRAASGHPALLLVAGLRGSVLLVHQPVPHREPAVLQPDLLLEPVARFDDAEGRGAGRRRLRDTSIGLYKQIQQVIYDQVPAISATTVVYQRAMLSSVQGYVDNPAYPSVVFVYDLQPSA